MNTKALETPPPIVRLRNAVALAETLKLPETDRFYGLLCNARGALKPGGYASDAIAASMAADLEYAAQRHAQRIGGAK